MSKVVRVSNSNYKVAVQSGGTITLDTGVDTGTTVITGNLEVRGTTTTIESTVTNVTDNILRINSTNGEGNASFDGIPASLGYRSGIEIERGQKVDARIVFDEQLNWTLGGDSGNGTFTFEAGTVTLPIKTPGIVAGGNLYVSTGAGVITVTGTTDYEEKIFTYDGSGNILGSVIDDDNIPNTKAVTDYVDFVIENTFQSRIDEGDTFVETFDFSVTGTESNVEIGVDNTTSAKFYNNRIEFSEIKIQNNEISTFSSNGDLLLSAPGTGSVKVKDILEITETPSDDDALTDPTAPLEGIKLYCKSQGSGKTSLYYVNSNNSSDEIVAKNRALLFSMLF